MRSLRILLRWQAVLWAASGATLTLAPSWLTEWVLDQPPLGEDVWIRVSGLMAIALAAQMVLVAHRIEDVWWWSWTFALLQFGMALVLVLHAFFGLPEGAAAWPWWTLGLLNAFVAVLETVALTAASIESPPL